ncbi:Drug/metabolite transporter (DMT)-like permease OS=Castellaniella defragrans OX=75697 GN=HNR28_000282 PE=4 SV=1 [Castellaniella defragrans]
MIGRAVVALVPPLTFNFLRWAVALVILLPLGWRTLRPGSLVWRAWRRFAVLGLLGVGLYNSLQYLALHTSTPINVTLVSASMPVWMLLVGRVFYGMAIRLAQVLGAVLSLVGVAVVLAQGQWAQLLALRFVAGDLLMVLATFLWAFYSWELTRPLGTPSGGRGGAGAKGARMLADMGWVELLLAQMVYGIAWSGAFSAAELRFETPAIVWGAPLLAAVAFVAIGPAVLAYRCWGLGIRRVGPTVAGFFFNLTPLFAAWLSLALLGERPRAYHALAFALILGGIVLSSRKGSS